ncbi:MAG: N4-gp56 family major capsid protein [Candidatus Kariarchaeaceae archaeon]
MAGLSKYGDITSIQQEYASKKFLEVFQKAVVTQRFGMAKKIPKHNTRTITFKRYTNLAVTTAPLSEGITPEAQKLTSETVSATLQQYGYLMELTDVVNDSHEDPVLQEMVSQIADAMVQTIELVTFTILKAGTNVGYANGTVRTSVNTVISRGDVRVAERTLRRSLAKKFTRIIAATEKVATKGVEASYFALVHPDLIPDISDVTDFIAVVEYGSVEQRVPGEIGQVSKTRFVEADSAEPWLLGGDDTSTMLSGGDIPSGTVKSDVYPVIVLGKDAYGMVRLQGRGAVQTFVQNPGTVRGGDALGQRGTVGNKFDYTALILNQDYMYRIEVACTANPT